MTNDRILLYMLSIIVIYLIYKQSYIENRTTEHMTIGDINTEALANLSSMYKSGVLNVSDLVVSGNATIGGNVTVTGNTTLNGPISAKNTLEIDLRGAKNDGKAIKIIGNENDGQIKFYKSNMEELATDFGYQVNAPNYTVNGTLHVLNGSRFSGGRHQFEDEEKTGKFLRVGSVYGIPGIWGSDGVTQLGDYTSGTDTLGLNFEHAYGDKRFNYLRSHEKSHVPLTSDNVSTTAQIRWDDGFFYTMAYRDKVRQGGHWTGARINL